MRKTRTSALVACVIGATLAAAACGAPPGSGGGDSSASPAATKAAKDLGIDLSRCPSDPTAKLTGQIDLGNTYAMSGGPATAFAPGGQASKAAVQNFSDTSGLPQKFNLNQVDDQFAPDKTLTATQGLIDKDNVAAMTGTIGTANILAIRPLLESSCVPLITATAGGASAQSPTKFPWTVAFSLPSAVDARAWAENIAEQFPEGKKVAVFYANDASGKEYLAAIQKFLGQTKSQIVATQTIEDTDSSAPASQVTTLRASGADILLAAPTGSQCANLMKETASQGWKPTFYMTSTCATPLFDNVGSAADGVYVNQFVKDSSRAPYNNDPDVQAAIAMLKKYTPQTPITNQTMSGVLYTEPLFEAVRQTEKSDLGLSRLGLLAAVTHLDFQPKLTIPGLRFTLNYPNDVVALESSELTRYKAADKSFDQIKQYHFEGQMTGSASVS